MIHDLNIFNIRLNPLKGVLLTVAFLFVLFLSNLYSASAGNKLTTTALNLRTETSTTSKIITTIPAGDSVFVVWDYADGWSLIIYNDCAGYVYSSYLVSGYVVYKSQISRPNYYINKNGQRVQSPTNYASVPRGATARCVDGTYSFSKNRRGTCSHHGGVAQWF